MRRTSSASPTASGRGAASTRRWMRSWSGSTGGGSTGSWMPTSGHSHGSGFACPRTSFDSMSHEWLMRFLEHRIGDRRMLRLIGKWLKAGVLEDGRLLTVERGTPQGAVISPLLANIYLHYVFDLWTQRWRQRHATGHVIVVRYADDVVAGFQRSTPSRHGSPKSGRPGRSAKR